jgi:hypothetical protein
MPIAAIAAIGVGVSVYGQWKAGQAAKKAGEAEHAAADSGAELQDYNAGVADLQAQDALDRGAEEEHRFRQGVDVLIGSQRAGIAAGNIDVGFGSALDVTHDAAFLGNLDALTIRNNAKREAWGFSRQAEDLRKRAVIARKTGVYLESAGRQQQTAARIGAVGTLASGAANLLSARYGWK